MKQIFLCLSLAICATTYAQNDTDTIVSGDAIIVKDARITKLEEKLASYNATNAANAAAASESKKIKVEGRDVEIVETSVSGIVLGAGYRLMVISTADRELAMRVRAQLYQAFPDQKQQMTFQMPNTKIKMGNYVNRGDAEKARKRIMAMKIVNNNIYIVPETIEIKVQKKVYTEVEVKDKKEDKKDKKDEKKKK
jgi:hypothetical protein